jgi:hypothetical protein
MFKLFSSAPIPGIKIENHNKFFFKTSKIKMPWLAAKSRQGETKKVGRPRSRSQCLSTSGEESSFFLKN